MVGGGELGQLKVVRGKQREGLGLVVQLRGNGAGQCQAVEGGSASPNFVHQHQALWRGRVQDLRAFGHLQHEGGLGVGQIVGRANAGMNRVDWPQRAGRGRHMAAHAGQQHDEGDLAHVGGLAAHVGPGDHLHALLGAQMRVVGDEIATR